MARVIKNNALVTQKTGGWNSQGEKTDHGKYIRKRCFKGDRGDVLLDLRFDATLTLDADRHSELREPVLHSGSRAS